MKIERFEVPGLAQYSYVVSCSGSAVVIDPIRDVDRYLAYANSEGLRITHVVETHIHADFASGSLALIEATGAELALSAYDEGESCQYAMPHRKLSGGDSIEFGTLRLQPVHTPGHTPEHLAFLLFHGAPEPVAMFSGDFLFAGSLGRPDLLGDAAKIGLAHDLYRSVQHLANLPDDLVVYPGHGAGSLCGSGMSGHAETTLAQERATNPFFRYDEPDFVEKILATVPPLPAYYPRMKALNARGAPALQKMPGDVALSPDQVDTTRQNATLLDVRSAETFAEAHIGGAMNIGAGASLSLWSGWLLDPERPIVLIAEDGDLEETRRSLVRVGLDNISGYLQGGMPAWIASGRPISQTAQTSVEKAAHNLTAVALDVRDDNERATGAIPGSQHIALGDLPRALHTLPKDTHILTICGSGYRSSAAASLLESAGFKNVSSIAGGMAAWALAGLPVDADFNARPS